MPDNRKHALEKIASLFNSQQFAVLSTHKNEQPYSSLVAFVSDDSLEQILFLTPNTTRKYENLIDNPKVAILINNSQNQTGDVYNAVSVTATGTASVIKKSDSLEFMELYLKKHPHMKAFSNAPTTAFVCVSVKRYFMVDQFQNVVEVKVKP